MTPPATDTFRSLGLAPKIIETLDTLRLETPTPIQSQAIPPALSGADVVGIAQTGTGKTLAFGLPLLQRIAASGGKGKALILVPTRELAMQVGESLGRFGRALGIAGTVVVGGASMGKQIADLKHNPGVIIATPGRLIDHLSQGTVKLGGTTILVLDEADRMLDMGFLPQIRQVLVALPKERQTMLFSATLSREIMELAGKHMKTPTSVEVAPSGTTAENVSQEFFIIHRNDKARLLESVLGKHAGAAIVFTRTKHGAKRLARLVRDMGHDAAEIHANRSFSQRKEAMEGFRTGKYRVLIATDIAARGIDVKGIELVVNFDMPGATEDYVHRIGRTARAGAAGHAISFATPDERSALRAIERLIRKPISVSAVPELPPQRAMSEPPHERGGFGGQGRGHRSRSFSSRNSGAPRRPHFRHR